ncbi:TPA: 1-deoxy-D-xylulose-5-phosphate reductoisomerase, partial [Candidatus Poribacteria bacterium]|nr:1-deoxy-D-xylulose-5-phosphate reductoisomerase [Candidatus Poribacteria bacterium]
VAREALEAGGGVPAIMNAANEVAVEGFLTRRIGFLEIVQIVEKTISKLAGVKATSLEEVCEIDKESRDIAEEFIKR